MSILGWTWLIVGASFALYIGIAIWGKAKSTGDFYVAEKQVHPLLNGMATGADWMSAASFISMAGLISFLGRDGSYYLMGWTGGYTVLAVLLAPYLRKYGKYTVPQFVGDRYYSNAARVVALLCAIFVSFTYVAGQMRGVGIVFSRFLNTSIDDGVVAGMVIVFFYATLGGMKGITYTQVAQYMVIIIAYLVPAIFISVMLTGNPIPMLGYGSTISAGGAQILGGHEGQYLLDTLNQISTDIGFEQYTAGQKPGIDVFMITFALMVGTAGLPHIIIRFFTVPKIRDARISAGWALVFIAILYTTAPAVAAFARTNFIKTINGHAYADAPSWFKSWERTNLVKWQDKNGDGIMQYAPGLPWFEKGAPATATNEVKVDNDIMVLANPEIAKLPAWVVALVAAGGLAAALSTAAGLLLVIAAAISHDLMKGVLTPNMSEKSELLWARGAAGGAVIVAGYFGIDPPGFVAQVVAFAFGLAASSFFPVIVMGIFWKRATKEGAMAGMAVGII
ncbi:MAG TPA: sodium:solute symporter family protein, partial [Thermoanaerobaculia bacterium]|nr:sodium:solute symporter family protein [Thermoanaerobaculia bacterium]